MICIFEFLRDFFSTSASSVSLICSSKLAVWYIKYITFATLVELIAPNNHFKDQAVRYDPAIQIVNVQLP